MGYVGRHTRNGRVVHVPEKAVSTCCGRERLRAAEPVGRPVTDVLDLRQLVGIFINTCDSPGRVFYLELYVRAFAGR